MEIRMNRITERAKEIYYWCEVEVHFNQTDVEFLFRMDQGQRGWGRRFKTKQFLEQKLSAQTFEDMLMNDFKRYADAIHEELRGRIDRLFK